MAATISQSNSEFVENVINNVSSDIIRITEDKLRLRLANYEKSIAHSFDWIGAAGIVITILLSLLTTDFKDKLGVKADTWNAIFVILLLVAIGYIVYAIIKAIGRKTIDEFILELKK